MLAQPVVGVDYDLDPLSRQENLKKKAVKKKATKKWAAKKKGKCGKTGFC